MKPSDRYLKIVEWSEEDGCYVGTCPGLMYGGVHGQNEAKVYKELCQAVEECIELLEEDRRPLPEPTLAKDFSGKFVMRVGKDLHKALAIKALRQGKSLNSYCVDVLREDSPRYKPSRRRPSSRKR